MKKICCIICGLSILLFSCREEAVELCIDPAQRIYLRATVETGITISRAPFSQKGPDERNPLVVAVWASTTPNVFENSGKNGSVDYGYNVALHTKAYFSNGKEQLLDQAVYPKPLTDTEEAKSVYFVGMHPEQDWEADETCTKAIKTFNGSEDVMFAPQIEGKYAENMETATWPIFKFKHLLTWLTVTVKAESEPVSDAWGKIKSLKVRATDSNGKIVGNTVTIDFTKYKPVDPNTWKDCVTFSTSAEDVTFDFYKTGTDNVFVDKNDENTWTPIPYDNPKEVAYVLCPPVTATVKNKDFEKTYEYTLIVETERRSVEVPVDLMMEEDGSRMNGSTMNYQFSLNMNFKMGNNIMLTSSVKDWQPGGFAYGVIDP